MQTSRSSLFGCSARRDGAGRLNSTRVDFCQGATVSRIARELNTFSAAALMEKVNSPTLSSRLARQLHRNQACKFFIFETSGLDCLTAETISNRSIDRAGVICHMVGSVPSVPVAPAVAVVVSMVAAPLLRRNLDAHVL